MNFLLLLLVSCNPDLFKKPKTKSTEKEIPLTFKSSAKLYSFVEYLDFTHKTLLKKNLTDNEKKIIKENYSEINSFNELFIDTQKKTLKKKTKKDLVEKFKNYSLDNFINPTLNLKSIKSEFKSENKQITILKNAFVKRDGKFFFETLLFYNSPLKHVFGLGSGSNSQDFSIYSGYGHLELSQKGIYVLSFEILDSVTLPTHLFYTTGDESIKCYKKFASTDLFALNINFNTFLKCLNTPINIRIFENFTIKIED